MTGEGAIIQTIEQILSRSVQRSLLVVLAKPVSPDCLRSLLERFPDHGFMTDGELDGLSPLDRRRVGYRYGPAFGQWQMPQRRFSAAVVLGSELNLRALWAAFRNGVRTVTFAGPDKATLTSKSVLAQ